MKIGLMSYEIESAHTLRDLFEKTKKYAGDSLQFSFHTFFDHDNSPDALMGRMPRHIPDDMIDEITGLIKETGIEISVMAGFWNMISNDVFDRDYGLLQLERIMQAARVFGCRIVNLCTGSKGDFMWHRSMENDTVKAWLDICHTMDQALMIAEQYDIQLGLEVEYTNVINTPEKAKKLIREMDSDKLKIVFDPANVFWPGQCKKQLVRDVMKNAFDLLSDDIICIHGKDVKEGPDLDFTYCGNGIVDFPWLFEELKKIGYDGPLVLHGSHTEEEVPLSVVNAKDLLRGW